MSVAPDIAYAAAARVCATRRPPSSRAVSAVSTIPPTAASVAGSRNAVSEPGNRWSSPAARNGSSGGWSK
jgi:hypothetical protein